MEMDKAKKLERKYIVLLASWQKVNAVKRWIDSTHSGDTRATSAQRPEKAAGGVEEGADEEEWFDAEEWTASIDDVRTSWRPQKAVPKFEDDDGSMKWTRVRNKLLAFGSTFVFFLILSFSPALFFFSILFCSLALFCNLLFIFNIIL